MNHQNHQSSTTFLKAQHLKLELKVDNGAVSKEALFYFLEDATLNFDNGADGELFGDANSDLQIYSQLLEGNLDKKYQIQSLPLTSMDNAIIPISVDANSGKEITFTVDITSFKEGIFVYLEDKITNTFQELGSNKNYKTALNQDINGFGRFYLHTSTTALSTEDFNENSTIYFVNNKDALIINGIPNNEFKLVMFDTLGKEIIRKTFKNDNKLDLRNFAKGIYIVKVQTENQQKTGKIIIE